MSSPLFVTLCSNRFTVNGDAGPAKLVFLTLLTLLAFVFKFFFSHPAGTNSLR
jgi:hypothetical protein